MRVVITDRIDSNSKKIKELLIDTIPDIEEVILVDNEMESLNYIRLNFELFIINSSIDGIDGSFINYCVKKGTQVIIFTEIEDPLFIENYSSLKIIDYIKKNRQNSNEILIETVKRYIRNSEIEILLFSDDSKSSLEIKNHIFSQNIELVEAKKFDNIIEILKNREIEILIIDFEMLNPKELDMISKIREFYSMDELPILLFSYFLRNYIIAEFLRVGVNNILYKPYLKEELINLVNLTLDKKELTKESYEWLLRDSISGLYHYQAIEEFGEKMLCNSKREKKPFSVILIKVIFGFKDNSKIKKNTVLKHFGNVLGSSLRRGDLIAKYGQDKAVLILQNTDAKNANIVNQKIKKHIEIFPALDENNQIIPYSTHPAIEEIIDTDLNTIVDRLDELIYREDMFR